ncbi:SDR family NAD(P)-dependent oxidoreductase [Sphingomonas bacterium]|uniref:SDR family NAD(P)-dependent oxidoreductase n=1 Tax=Sphingomonas bacterium TaxID=1895847 RepID=UPI001574FC21|nr:SDR family oxidoreductase [Sphingomonas bacterium]
MAIDRLQTLFVTGGGGGIGLAVARHGAAAGMNVVLADINGDRLDQAIAGFDTPVHAIVMDVASIADWSRARAEAEAVFGGVDLLVNGAALPPSLTPILDMDVDAFDRVIRANLCSLFYGTRTFGPTMRDRGYGHIVNIASEAGLVPLALLGDYGAAKYGVVGFTEILRLELADTGVGATVVTPGLTETNMTIGMGMDPSHVGRAIIDGVRRNAAYVITHPDVRAAIGRRFDAIVAAIGAPAQPGWVSPKTQWE